MSKPSVLDRDQIKHAPYLLATRDLHVVMSEGDTLYARGFTSPAELGSHYDVVRVGDALVDPDDNRVLGYDGIFTGSGHVTRQGDPTTLIMTESTQESRAGDKLIPGGVEVPLDFTPSPPRVKTNGRIIAVSPWCHHHRPVRGGGGQSRRPRRPCAGQRARGVRHRSHRSRHRQEGVLQPRQVGREESRASVRTDRYLHGVQDLRQQSATV